MKKTISRIMGGFTLVAAFALVMTSCKKDQASGLNSSFNDGQVAGVAKEAGEEPASGCGFAIPDSLQAPEGNKFTLQAYATGFQIYEVRRSTTDPNVFVWVFVAPSATLYLKPDYTNQVGTHYAGPSWEFTKGVYKGEKTVAAKLKGATLDPTAIPWLLLKTVDAQSSAGNKVTYIQRVCTTGGLAPATTPVESQLGQLDSIPYTATYRFFEARN